MRKMAARTLADLVKIDEKLKRLPRLRTRSLSSGACKACRLI